MSISLAWLYEKERAYSRRTGKAVWSMSDWHNDPGDVVLPTSMLNSLVLEQGSLSRYRFLDTAIETKTKIGLFYSKVYNLPLVHGNLAISHNGTAALHLAIRALATVGVDRMLVVTPAYFSLFDVLKLYGITTTYVHTDLSDLSALTVERLLSVARDQLVQAIFLTNPIFCTGKALGAAELEALAQYAERTGTWLVVDDILGGLPWSPNSDRPFVTSAMRNALGHPRSIYLWSVSKSLFLNGLKHALVMAPSELVRDMEKSADSIIGGLSSHQLALVEQIYSETNIPEILQCINQNIGRFAAAYDLCVTALTDTSLRFTPVEAGFHGIAYLTESVTRPVDLAQRIASEMIGRFGVSAIPLAHFGFPPFSPVGFRINLSKNAGRLGEALIQLSEIVHENSYLSH